MQLGQTKARSIRKYLEASSKHGVLVQFKGRSEKRIAILSNTITRNRSLRHTTCDLYRDNGMHEDKRGDFLFQSMSAYKISSFFAETEFAQWTTGSTWSRSKRIPSGSFGETHSSSIDNRIPGIPHSTVQQQDTNRRETVKQLIQQFENHPHKESFLPDMKQTEKINAFSERSKKLITDMGNTEIFELCETSSKIQCPDCALFWQNWLCVLLMWKKSHTLAKDQTARLEELWRLIFSRLRHQKRASPMGLNMELPKGNECTTTQRRCCRKLANPSMEDINPKLERWHTDNDYRKSLSEIGWTEEHIIQYDKLALEDNSYFATPKERARNDKKWVLSLNKEGVQGPVNQRPDLLKQNQQLERLHDEYVKETSEEKYTDSTYTTNKTTQRSTIWRTWRKWLSSWSSNRMEDLHFEVTGKPAASNIFVLVNSVGTARQLEQKLEFLATLILDWMVVIFFSSEMLFSLAGKFELPGNRRGCRQTHLLHATFSHAQSLHSTDDMCAWLEGLDKLKSELCVKNHSFIHASCLVPCCTRHWTPAQVLSHLHLLCCIRPLLRLQACCPRNHLPTANTHGRMALMPTSPTSCSEHQSSFIVHQLTSSPIIQQCWMHMYVESEVGACWLCWKLPSLTVSIWYLFSSFLRNSFKSFSFEMKW